MTSAEPLKRIDSVPVGELVVSTIEDVLDQARDGRLSMVAIATVERDGTAGRCWSFCHNTATLIGAIELMKRDIIEKNRDD